MPSKKRIILIEKFKPWSYIDKRGHKIWLDKYGEFVKRQLPNGEFSTQIWSGMTANWTVEMAQDLQAYHGIDAEAELTAMLSEEITQEIMRILMNPSTFAI